MKKLDKEFDELDLELQKYGIKATWYFEEETIEECIERLKKQLEELQKEKDTK